MKSLARSCLAIYAGAAWRRKFERFITAEVAGIPPDFVLLVQGGDDGAELRLRDGLARAFSPRRRRGMSRLTKRPRCSRCCRLCSLPSMMGRGACSKRRPPGLTLIWPGR